MDKYPGIEGVIARYDYGGDNGVMGPTQAYDLFHRLCPPELIAEDMRSPPAYVRLVNGSRVTFMGTKEHKASAEFGFIIIDQAEEVPESTIRLLSGRLRQRLPDGRYPDFKMLLTCNPHPSMEWFLKEAEEHPEDYIFVLSLPDDNKENLPPDFFDRRRAAYDEHQWARYILGHWDVFEGQALPEFDRNVHVIDPFTVPRDWPVWLGIDHGMNHPTVALWLTQSPESDYFFIREYCETGRSVTQNAQAISTATLDYQLRGAWLDPRMPQIKDLTDPEWSAYKEYGKYIPMVQPAMVGSATRRSTRENRLRAWKEVLKLDPMRRHFLTHQAPAPRLYVFKGCERLIWELPRLQLTERAGYEDVEKVDDDAFDAGGFILTHVVGNPYTGGPLRERSYMTTAR
jgi:hypothetical protein